MDKGLCKCCLENLPILILYSKLVIEPFELVFFSLEIISASQHNIIIITSIFLNLSEASDIAQVGTLLSFVICTSPSLASALQRHARGCCYPLQMVVGDPTPRLYPSELPSRTTLGT